MPIQFPEFRTRCSGISLFVNPLAMISWKVPLVASVCPVVERKGSLDEKTRPRRKPGWQKYLISRVPIAVHGGNIVPEQWWGHLNAEPNVMNIAWS